MNTLCRQRFALIMLLAWLSAAPLVFAQSTAPAQKKPPATVGKDQKAPSSASSDTTLSPWLKKQAAGSAARMVAESPFTVLTELNGVDLSDYLDTVRDKINRSWQIYAPQGISELRKPSDVQVEVKIGRDGRLSDMRITRSSGFEVLDKGVWNGVVNAAPFAPLPKELTSENIGLRMNFTYPGERTKPAKTATSNQH